MTRTVLRSVDQNRRPQAGYTPTPNDIAAWLDENPDRIPEVHACSRATGPWEHAHGVVMRCRLSDGRTVAAGVRDDSWGEDGTHREIWRWWAGLGADRVEGTASDRAQACDHMDAALRLRGRVLR